MNPNLYDRSKYSMVLDENSGRQQPPVNGPGAYPPPMNGPGAYPPPMNGAGAYPPQYQGGAYPPQYQGGAYPPMQPGMTTGNRNRMATSFGDGLMKGMGFGLSPDRFRPDMGMPGASFGAGAAQSYDGEATRREISSKGIAATIQEMEALRKSINSRIFWGAVIMIASLVIPLFFIRSGPRASGGMLYIVMPIGIFASIALFAGDGKKKARLKALYKETFVRQLLQEHFQDVYYNWEQGLDQTVVSRYGVCRLGNRYYTEDYLNAVYRGIRFQQADVKIQYHTSGKNSHTTTYFQGRMFCIEYPMKFTRPVQIYSKRFIYPGKPVGGVDNKGLKLESVEFNKEFTVRSQSEHEAFYILTPQLMERIQFLGRKYGCITMTFDNGSLMVGLNTKMDSFDADLKKPIDYPQERLRMRNDVAVIEELIQLLQCIPT